MPVFRVKIPADQLGKEIAARRKQVIKSIRMGVTRGVQRGKLFMVRRTSALKLVDTGQLKNSFRVRRVNRNEIHLDNDAPYAGIIDMGARPHPVNKEGIEAIALWAKRKFGLGDDEAYEVANAVAWKLRKKGQKPTYLFRDAQPKLTRFVKKNVERAIADRAGKRAS